MRLASEQLEARSVLASSHQGIVLSVSTTSLRRAQMLMVWARFRCLAAIAIEAPSSPGEMIVSLLINFVLCH